MTWLQTCVPIVIRQTDTRADDILGNRPLPIYIHSEGLVSTVSPITRMSHSRLKTLRLSLSGPKVCLSHETDSCRCRRPCKSYNHRQPGRRQSGVIGSSANRSILLCGGTHVSKAAALHGASRASRASRTSHSQVPLASAARGVGPPLKLTAPSKLQIYSTQYFSGPKVLSACYILGKFQYM